MTQNSLRINATLRGGTYRIDRVLGQGGFGITYLATDLSLDKPVAIKEFFPKDFCDRDATTSHVTLGTTNTSELVNKLKAKFLKEAKNIAKFNHPNIIKIFAAFEENNTAYYVMEYIEGVSLSEMVKRKGRLAADVALNYISQIGSALDYVHSFRINHLDVKPANIMVRKSDNCPILIDFGLSKQYDSIGHQTSTTPVGISHGFAPGEQYRAGGVREFSPTTDEYSLAATLYFILSGVVPPEATKLIEEDLIFPDAIPTDLITPISKAMSSARKDRYPTVRDFVSALSANTEDTTISQIQTPTPKPDPTPTPDPGPTPKPWKKILMAGGGVVAAVAVLLIALIIKQPWKSQGGEHPDSLATTTTVENKTIDHEYVDLGLSIKWATCNVGASSPSDYGDYYAWGETSTKSSYEEENSKTKTSDKSMNDIGGNSSYDVARAKWGGSWRLPTKAEFQELIDKCTWTWTTQGGHNGYKVTGKNGKSIFLPATGWREGTLSYFVGESGNYWGSTLGESNTDDAYDLFFNSSNYYTRWVNRFYGYSVRPVVE